MKMDSCTNCGGCNLSHVGSYLTCLDCGLMMLHQPVYTFSYDENYSPMRQRAVYNRTKRFTEFIFSFENAALKTKLREILDMYNIIEFYFAIHKKGTERKYFYSRKVVLRYIVKRLDIDFDVPLLKDMDRNKKQIASILELRDIADKNHFL